MTVHRFPGRRVLHIAEDGRISFEQPILGADGHLDEATVAELDRTMAEARTILDAALAQMEARGIDKGTISYALAVSRRL
jgi:hypothetical protein